MALEPGTRAPDFTLPTVTDEGVEHVTLSDQFGRRKVVLLFFPLAFTPVCVDEMCGVSQNLGAYEELDAQVYGISVDSPFAQAEMASRNGIRFPLLSDFNKEAIGAYDVRFEDLKGLKGVAKRSAFVINQDGAIAYSWSSDNPKDTPDFDALQAALKAV